MSKISQITSNEFQLLLSAAQKSHIAKDEPIPELLPDRLSQVEGCLNSPFQTFNRTRLYRGFISKVAKSTEKNEALKYIVHKLSAK